MCGTQLDFSLQKKQRREETFGLRDSRVFLQNYFARELTGLLFSFLPRVDMVCREL